MATPIATAAAPAQSVKPALPTILQTPITTARSNVSMNEHNKRLMAALAPKPIEGVDNWGIPDEPDTPCDAEREVNIEDGMPIND